MPLPDERQALEVFLVSWLQECVKPTVRPRTYQSYKYLVDKHISPELGRVPLARMTPQNVSVFLRRKRAGGLSARSVQYLHAVLRRALGQAERWGLVQRNIAKLVDPPRAERPEVHALSPDEARALLTAVRGDRLEALFSVGLSLGLRLGEALALQWECVDLDKARLSVRATLQRVDGRLRCEAPKSDRSRRTLTLPRFTVAALRDHRRRQLEERLLAGPGWEDTGFVFTTKQGRPLDPCNVSRHRRKLLKAANLPVCRYHDLRHTAATLLLTQGVHPRVVMELLGHSEIGITMNTYTHVIPSLRRAAAEKMDAALADAE